MAQSLTDRQQEILDFIRAWTKEHRYPPTLREIGRPAPDRREYGGDILRALTVLARVDGTERAR